MPNCSLRKMTVLAPRAKSARAFAPRSRSDLPGELPAEAVLSAGSRRGMAVETMACVAAAELQRVAALHHREYIF